MYLNTNYWTSTRPKPTAHITRSKNRLKSYNDTIYLKDGSNFEIELYNPTQGRVLAQISINGVKVSAGGIIVNPGQRVFLERFIDSEHKFEFSTYWVGKTGQDKHAIEKNGQIEVIFHQEVGTESWAPYWGDLASSDLIFGTTTGSNAGGFANDGTAYKMNWMNPQKINFTAGVNSSLILDSSANLTYTSNASVNRTETGRVEKGERSDQVLETAHGKFYDFAFAMYGFKILPESQKTVEAGEIRNYCPGCGARVKKSTWRFCPSCGESLNN
jgi:hypothetical protein